MNKELADALIQAVRAQDFAATPDKAAGGTPVRHFPSIDLAVVVFSPERPTLYANVLFSREHPQGVIADIEAHAGATRDIRFERDLQDEKGRSIAWHADADWRRLPLRHLYGEGTRFVAPYPASLLKLMVAVGIGLAIDRRLIHAWPDAVEPMIVRSDNDATTDMVALLHRLNGVAALNQHFVDLGLHTLQLNDTTTVGGWRNGDGSGVGHIHMTAWDTARLLWLLDADAPAPPWPAPGTRLLQAGTRDHLRGVLRRQQLDHVLSSGTLRDVPGCVAGLPDAPTFAHKTGSTENYSADAGIVHSSDAHCIVAMLSNLGTRYAPDDRCATTWRMPALGAAIHRLVQPGPDRA